MSEPAKKRVPLRIHDPPKKRNAQMRPLSKHHHSLLLALLGSEGMTAEEISLATGRTRSDVTRQTLDLRYLGLLEDSGLSRKTSRGKSAIVWRLTPLGVEKARDLPPALGSEEGGSSND